MPRRCALLLAFPLVISAAALPTRAAQASVNVERLELDARIDPTGPALYAKANMVLRNRDRMPVELIDFEIPAPLGARATVENVWDRNGQLAWRSDAVEANQPLSITVALRLPLTPGDRQRIVIAFALRLADFNAAAPAQVSARSAQLAMAGWYPTLAGPEVRMPEWIRCTVRLPKDWQVEGIVRPKRVLEGEASASYELTIKGAPPNAVLFRAHAPQ